MKGIEMAKQIKSKERVSSFGEVYTARKQVCDMLDLIPPLEFTVTYLEPACGNGNFLIEIISRKLAQVKSISKDKKSFIFNTVKAVSSVYGVDIQPDNVDESRTRLFATVKEIVVHLTNEDVPSNVAYALRRILEKNIVCGNTLTATANDGSDLKFSEWDILNDGTVVCKEYLFKDILAANGETNDYISKQEFSWLTEVATEIAA